MLGVLGALVGAAVRIERALNALARLFCGLAAVCLFVIVGIISASVVMRRAVGSPLYYTEELVGLLLTASLFLALPMVTRESSHVRVTLVATYLSDRGRVVLAALAGMVSVAFCVWFLVEAYPWLQFALRRNIKTEASGLLLAPWMALLPISIALSGLMVAVRVLTGADQASIHSSNPGE